MTLSNITHILIAVLFVNFVADHIFQISEVRDKKRNSFAHLCIHILLWSALMQITIAWLAITFKPDQFFHYYFISWILTGAHLGVDLFCSYLYRYFERKNRHSDALAAIVIENIAMNCLIVKSVLIICL